VLPKKSQPALLFGGCGLLFLRFAHSGGKAGYFNQFSGSL